MICWHNPRNIWAAKKVRTRIIIATLVKSALVALALSATGKSAPLIVYNASASVPLGFYRITSASKLNVDDLVLVRTPGNVRALADQRRYLPNTVPMLKHVAAQRGDRVCARQAMIFINEKWVAERQLHDQMGRPLPWWIGCRTLSMGDVFLLNANVPQSFDGRYFGVTNRRDIVGKATAL